MSKNPDRRHSRGGKVATAVASVLVLSGVGLIGVSVAFQERAPVVPAQSGSIAEHDSGASAADPGNYLPVTRSLENPRSSMTGPVLPRSKPVSLEIPAIDVQSTIQDLGLTEDGALETPAPGPRYNEAAWYRHSPTPGSLGPAVLLGHVDSAAEGPSVFFRLGELKPGDRVMVTRADGSEAEFSVDAIRRYAKDDFPTKTVYGDIDHAGLRILTCGGAFDEVAGHYLDNIVVFASLVQ